jgi:hypothetical protein
MPFRQMVKGRVFFSDYDSRGVAAEIFSNPYCLTNPFRATIEVFKKTTGGIADERTGKARIHC